MNKAPVLPVPSEIQMRGVAHQSPFQLYQMLRYLLHVDNGQRGDVISAVCKIRNPSDLKCKYKHVIANMGLFLECIEIKTIVKVGGYTRNRTIGTWHLSIIDPDKWERVGAKSKAANDSSF